MSTFQDGTYTGLTPDEVATKRFTPVRGGREGYDMEEVDGFLDEVEASIVGLAQAYTQAAEMYEEAEGRARAASERVRELENELVRARDGQLSSEPSVAVPSVDAPVEVSSLEQSSTAAARLLAHATSTAEAIEAEAQAESARIREEAEAHARSRHEEIESNFQAAARDLEEKRAAALDELELARVNLTTEVEGLRAFEAATRQELSAYLADLHARVQAPMGAPAVQVEEAVAPEVEAAPEPEAVEAPAVDVEVTEASEEVPAEGATEVDSADAMPESEEVQHHETERVEEQADEAPSFAEYQEETRSQD